LQQQAILQIFIPIWHALLAVYANYDPLDAQVEIATNLGKLLSQTPNLQVLAFINGEVQRGACSTHLRYFANLLVIRLSALHTAFPSLHQLGISHCLRLFSEVVGGCYTPAICCYLLAKWARFPGVQAQANLQ
jgi:hypothetical protein